MEAPAPQGAAPQECHNCKGKGHHPEDDQGRFEACNYCDGTGKAQGAPHEGGGLDLEARLRAAFEEGLEAGVEEGLYLSSPTPGGMPRDPSGRDVLWEKSGTRASLEGRAS